MDIGKIKQVPLREIWKREDSDFTVWLENNIDYLNEVLDFEVSIEEREKRVGSFSLDLYGDDGLGGKVIIENQLEKTDHDHLGKVLTYLTNLVEAKRAIWITSQPREEHGRAIDWLNEYTPSDIAFYLVKLEAIRIGDHPVSAPQFTVVNGPSEQIKQIGQEKKNTAARDSIRREFWKQFINRMAAVDGAFADEDATTRDWLSKRLGMTGLFFNVYCTGKYVRTEIQFNTTREENKRRFDFFFQRREEMESAFGAELEWERMSDKVQCRIKHQLDGVDWRDQDDWGRILDFLVDSAPRMDKVATQFAPQLKSEW